MSDQNSETKQRRDELVRCKDIIGWSWLTVGQRLALNSSQAFALKACKREISDADLDWMRDLADAVAARPRPIAAPTHGPRLVADLSMGVGPLGFTAAMVKAERPAVMSDNDLPAELYSDQPHVPDGLDGSSAMYEDYLSVSGTVNALAEVYASLATADMTAEALGGAQWAISDVALKLGVLDQVAARIKAARAITATVPPVPHGGMLPRELDRPGGAWERPTGVTGGMQRVPMD